MKRFVLRLALAAVAALTLLTHLQGAALAQAQHFVGAPTYTDQGTTVLCIGKVAGLGDTHNLRCTTVVTG